MASDVAKVSRKIYFFRVEHFAEIRESLPGACERISGLSFTDSGRYRLDTLSKNRYALYPDSLKYPLKMRFGKIRRDALPQVEHAGELSTLDIDENAGLADLSHITIFDDGFVAAEWNSDGPKLSQLTPYFHEKGRLNSPPKFLTLFERDILEVVRKLHTVRMLEVELPPESAKLAREADHGLYAAIKASEALGATKRIGLKLTADKGSERLLELTRRLASLVKNRPHEVNRFNTISARGYDGKSRTARYIDILQSKMLTTEEFAKSNSRSAGVDTEEAYRLLQKAYIENIDRLTDSAFSRDM
ncbi:hypothetical protein [Novosphingopyxis baekryungensis]|uniref:hypothetical protein n=1 Tax=Novosphingopyxis baekryungensis TaxID=279369 RepID=UPI0012EB894A|nr:hypothetical protein [Novosphingopyxis baekryungensis]